MMESETEISLQHIAEKTFQSNHIYRYNKSGRRADMTGELYEVKMSLLLFLRGINRTSGFYIASNVHGAGAFNDIVFKFKPFDAPDTFKTCFLQLKHKKTKLLTLRGLRSNSGDFSLGKYHESYCEVSKRMEICAGSDDIIFNGSFANTWFVIYTNAPAEYKLANHGKSRKYSNSDKNILSSGKELEFIFHFLDENAINYKLGKNFSFELKIPKKEFLDALQIYCGQASERELDTFIEFEVDCALRTSKDVTKSISKHLTSMIIDWWRDSSIVLTETSIIWQEVVESRIAAMNISIKKYLDDFDIIYNEQAIQSFYLHAPNNRAMLVTAINTRLTNLKILQFLERYYAKHFIFMDLKSLLLHKPEVLCLWSSTWCNVMAIECSSYSIEELMSLLNEWNEVSLGKLIILVTKSCHKLSIMKLHGKFMGNCTHMQDLFVFKQLDTASQVKVLEKQVIFQGIPINLSSVVKENTKEISGDILCHLICNSDQLTIGSRLADVITYYIPRRLKRFDCLQDKFIVNNCHKEYFVISDILEQEIQLILPYGEKVNKYINSFTEIKSHFLIADHFFSEQDFINICTQNTNKSLHWLMFYKGLLVWKQSNKNITLIRQNLDSDRYSIHLEGPEAVSDRVVLVTAEPGMGKSTLITHLAKQIQNDDPSLWIIRLNLNDATAMLEQVDENYFDCINNTINFIALATIGLEKSKELKDFELRLFILRLKAFENVAIFIDGFDEISPDFTYEVISLLKCLLKTKVQKLWITSRVAMRSTLEQALSVISYTLQPFTVDDQHSILIQYWTSVTNIGSLEQLKHFAGLLLDVTSKSLNDHDREFTCIPFQTCMLAEAFEKEMTYYIIEGINSLPTRLNLFELYEHFIEKKQYTYCTAKPKWDTSKSRSSHEIERLKELFLTYHMSAALVLLVSVDELMVLDSFTFEDAKVFLEEISKVEEKRVIVDGIMNNEPHFIHRTFAEYFLALWLSQHLASVYSFLQNNLFNENYQTIRYFFDCILCKGYQFHHAVLSGDKKYIQSFLPDKNLVVNLRDKGDRTALHLAASYPDLEPSASQSTVELLIDWGSFINSVDSVLQWTPLRYADVTKLWGNIDKLLCKGANRDHLVQTKRNIYDGEMLCEAAEHGYLKLMAFALDLDCDVNVNIVVKQREKFRLLHVAADAGNIHSIAFLLSRGANINVLDVSKRTPLHIAVCKGHLAVVEFLIGKGADIMCRDKEHCTPLHWAVNYGHKEIVECLVGRGADVSAVTRDYLTSMNLAAANGYLSIVQFLKDHGADIMSSDQYKTTPLQEAAARGHLDVVNFLVESGADTLSCDVGGKTPLHWACIRGHLSVVEFLVTRGVNVNSHVKGLSEPLHWAATKGHLAIVIFLVEKGADMNSRDKNDATPLLLAADNGHLKVVEYLVDRGANIILSCKDGLNPLQLASKRGFLSIVDFLAGSGADITMQDTCGKTPLHLAAEFGHLEVIQYLVGMGALIDAKDSMCQTPLELATEKEQWDTVQWLASNRVYSE